jgi:PAS domain S-box-containing protein
MAGAGLRADMSAVRLTACLRLGLVIGVVSVGSYGHHSGPARALFVLLGLVGVPWATIVLFAADRPGSRWAVLGGPAGDVLALFAVHALIPEAGDAVLLGYLVVVAFAGYTTGRAVAAPLAALSLVLVVGAESLGPGSDRIDSGVIVAFTAAMAALVFLLDRMVAVQLGASARSTRLEGKADAILARVADCVVVTDGQGQVLQCNVAAERLIGLPEESTVGRSCDEVLGLRSGDVPLQCSRRCGLLALAESSGSAPSHETWRLDHSGRKQPLLANAEAVIDDRGRTVEVVHSLRDITRLKQAEEAKTLFLATASHELKTPLTVIRGFADTLLAFDDFEPERRTAALEAIRVRSEELVRIVDRLLLSSRIEAGRVQVSVTRVALAPLLVERIRALQAATGREISLELDPSVPDVSGDAPALATVVDHLLDNALKYSPGGEPVVVRVRAEGEAVLIDVEDAGVGMDAEQAARCFEKFWQAESTDVRRFGGTGIGLYIVRSLVEAMGGSIAVRSTPGTGSTFSITLSEYHAVDVRGTRDGHDARDMGEATSIREFMRQIGVPERSAP